jgi:NAD(P)H-hydrate epimerase
MVVTCREMQDAEEAAFARGISAASLMEEAGEGIAKVIGGFFPRAGHAVLFLGKGNNAGDALVAARHLIAGGWQVHARPAFDPAEFKELPAEHWRSLEGKMRVMRGPGEIAQLEGRVVLVDGLVGIGATGPLGGPLAAAAGEMNHLRKSRHAVTVALDIPSGLDPVSGIPGAACVEADLTITIAQVKDALVADAAVDAVGRLALVTLRGLPDAKGDDTRCALTARILRPLLPRRPFDFHKGRAGRVAVVAGSRGFLGAAALCAEGALRGGAGLVTIYAKQETYALIAPLAPREVMVKAVNDYGDAMLDHPDALAIGPGLGFEHEGEVLALIRRAQAPAVIDADALSMLARRGWESLTGSGAPRLLTPHPGELARLAEREPAFKDASRAGAARAVVDKFPDATVLLKGARTIIATRGRPLCFNTTGNPGMASGGMGDVLTGLCAALAAQRVALHDAACLGAWLSGRAAEIAVRDGAHSQESLSAGVVGGLLGAAFEDLRAGVC